MNTGIICEFNPFHSGHKYLIDTVKNGSDDNAVICVMSGNFVQRGEFAVYDKFKRAKTAIENGADMIIELPCVYSTLSAEGFAKYGVEILESTGIIDEIAFGAECDDIKLLYDAAKKIEQNDRVVMEALKSGISYPAARKIALGSDILDTPNNILAVEYIRHSTIPCRAVRRIGKGHDTDDSLYSASAIRKELSLHDICSMKNCERAVMAKLRTMCADDFLEIEDVSEGLENRIIEAVRNATSLDDIYDFIKTKRYTHARIRRIILRAYLSITKNYPKCVPYIRILGFNEKGRSLLTEMKKKATLPVISRYSDIDKLKNEGKKLLDFEYRCTDLYNLGYKNPLPCATEQRSRIIVL